MAPFLVLFLIFFIGPILYALNLSLYLDRGVTHVFVGLDNYKRVIHDSQFTDSVLRMFNYGIVQVPVMNLIMGVPIKVATTTSTYVIGITAMAGAFVYYNHAPHSYVDPSLAVPVTIGVFIGASIGSRVLGRIPQNALRNTFTVVMAVYTVQMVLRVFNIGGG